MHLTLNPNTMSGIKRIILAELKGQASEKELKKALSPENIRTEKGDKIDKGEYKSK